MHKRLNSAAEFMFACYTADTFVFTGKFQNFKRNSITAFGTFQRKKQGWIKLLGWKRGIRCWRNVRLRFGGFSLNADFMNARIISAADVVQYFFLQFHISGFFLSLCMADSPEHSQSVYIYSLAHCIFYYSADCFRPNASHLPSISSMTNSLF